MKLSSRGWIIGLALAALLGVGAWLGWQSLVPKEPAPAVSYTLLDGSKHHSDAWRGKVVLVNFWATSCTTCVAEMPEIVATWKKYAPKGYDTVAVAMSYDRPAYVSHFAQSRGLPFGVTFDDTGAIAKAYGDVKLTPTTFLLNKKGEIVKRYVGAPDFHALHALVEKLLAEPA